MLTALGATTADEATALLGEWAERGPELARTVRATRPWATASYVVDLGLRLALGADYLARREVTDPTAVGRARPARPMTSARPWRAAS